MTARRRYSYRAYDGGPDPLAPPFDLREAIDRIGADVLDGSSPRQALQELLRRGLGERRGLDELTRQLWQRRRELQRNNRLDGTLQQVRPDQQQVLRLFSEGVSFEDIASIMNLSGEEYARRKKYMSKEALLDLVKEDPEYQEYQRLLP